MQVAVVYELEVLRMHSEEEAVVPTTHIDIGAILHLALLSKVLLGQQSQHKEERYGHEVFIFDMLGRIHTFV